MNLGKKEDGKSNHAESDPMTFVNEGLKLAQQGKYDESESSYYKMFGINPEFTVIWYDIVLRDHSSVVDALLCDAFAEADNNKRIELFNKVLDLHPKNTRALMFKGGIFSDLGRHHEAIASYRKAFEINPRSLLILFNWARLDALNGNNQNALKWFSEILEIEPENKIAQEKKKLFENNLFHH